MAVLICQGSLKVLGFLLLLLVNQKHVQNILMQQILGMHVGL